MNTVEAMRLAINAIAGGDEVTISIKGDGYSHTIICDEGMVKSVI